MRAAHASADEPVSEAFRIVRPAHHAPIGERPHFAAVRAAQVHSKVRQRDADDGVAVARQTLLRRGVGEPLDLSHGG